MKKQFNVNQSLSKKIIEAIRISLNFPKKKVYLHEPKFIGNELSYLKECIDTTFVSSIGEFVNRFEKNLKNYTGSKFVVAVVNGTAALHIAMKLVGVCRGDEVLLPALNFIASANAVSYCNAIPHFVDSEEKILGIDSKKLEKYLDKITEQKNGLCINRKTQRIIRACVPTHVFGHPVDLNSLIKVTNKFNIELVEDAAESLGSFYHKTHTGTFGKIGILSFNGNKILTTGGGGAILTNDKIIADRAKHLTTTAKKNHEWELFYEEVGYNYRMPNINAALGCAQLEKIPELLKIKRKLFKSYKKSLNQLSLNNDIEIFQEPKGCSSNYWLQTLLLTKSSMDQRDDILYKTNQAGFNTRPAYSLSHKLPHFKNYPKMDLTVAESLEGKIINLPSNETI